MATRLRRGLTLALAAGMASLVGLAAPAGAQAASGAGPYGPTVDLQILAVNDFHGNLEPPAGSAGQITLLRDGQQVRVPAGGAEYLATHLRQARAANPNTVVVGVGDLIGASPLLSAAFHDEPTIQAMDLLGMETSPVGNHEFDEGKRELLRVQYGGCYPDDGCYDPEHPYPGARFRYLAANVVDEATGAPLLPPFWVKNIRGARVGFIGVVTKDTPNVTTAEGTKGLRFLDEAETINKYAQVLRRLGVRAIVALVHEGGVAASPVYDYDCDAPTPGAGVTGPIVDIAERVDPEVDVILTAHTHNAYVCTIPDPSGRPRLVAQGASFGRLITDVDVTYDRRTRDIRRVKARNIVVTRDVPKDPAMSQLIQRYQKLIEPIANRVVGYIGADILGRGAGTPETPLGDLIADAQVEATRERFKAEVAFMNPGGVRSDLAYAASGAEGDGVVTYAEAFAVQPFGNVLVTMDLTGAQILKLLQQQYSEANAASPRVLQPSEAVRYTVDLTRTGADRIVADSVRINGQPLDLARVYKVTVNEFLAGGGDGFTVLKEGRNPQRSVPDLDAFVAYLGAHSSPDRPLQPPKADRITFLG
ncbi:5'-nucleotidase [Carbonactinospora thermoautotrophica]|uniref:5'-nucleotidase n=2 Tax=Carbonactinospora thermoautotrophica TaxID=1469144 RepID=A0A132MYS7_9ACTN|nr:bifunctional metallophosphatase/5'-nucleotidase [Carbonactinospora thermoautotrophica]KWW98005.1 5'-nucleotidase [Carbonactinospora thermoautotrophica]KWX03065.1 5'-nucleotidase [Carbonactinospora thermoautotrophica]